MKASRELLQSGEHADFTFCIDGERIPAHSQLIFVRAADTALARMLSMPMKELNEREADIHDIPIGIFRLLLEFIYTSYCTVPEDIASTLDLYIAADMLQILDVSESARLLLMKQLKSASLTEQCLALEKFGDVQALDAAIFKFICTKSIFRNWDQVQSLEAWQKVTAKSATVEEFGIIARNAATFSSK
ncbi:hypothetical protein HK097_009485 [Rhizophlyctis rosea]|uniref:BTB domain-containing protein n=1 Tax=Rhizophlyctis rosea TaxID=64517 RepID=A0AAD5X465_9FUNG|nr:hypothetical protein HK097_009485 [Rhizophlyctis rosea]